MRCFNASQEVTDWLNTPGVDAFQIPERCQDALNTLSSCLQHHIHCPVALGGGKKMGDLAQKGAALAHTFSLENPDWSQLLKYLQSFLSITTDLGTESGLAHLRVALQGLFPAWHDLDPMELDGEDLGQGPAANPNPPRPDDVARQVLSGECLARDGDSTCRLQLAERSACHASVLEVCISGSEELRGLVELEVSTKSFYSHLPSGYTVC